MPDPLADNKIITVVSPDEQKKFTPAESRQYIEAHGGVFIEKPQYELPKVDSNKLAAIFGENSDLVKDDILPKLTGFMDKVPIVSSHDHDLDEVRKWRYTFPTDIRLYYERTNQLRKNGITGAIFALSAISNFSHDQQLNSRLDALAIGLINEYNGIGCDPYIQLSNSRKLEYTQKIEQIILSLFQLFSAEDKPQIVSK